MNKKEHNPLVSLVIDKDELQAYVVELIITSHELAKQLDNLRYQYEMTIGKLSLECFKLFMEINRLDKIIAESEKANANPLFAKKTYQNVSSEEFNHQLMQKYQVILNNHRSVINDHVCQILNPPQEDKLRDSYRFIILKINPDVNPNIAFSLLETWHQAESYFSENNLEGLLEIEKQVLELNIAMPPMSAEEKIIYEDHLRSYANTLEEEIALYSDPSYHPFWIDLLNEDQTINDINEQINLFRSMIIELTNKIQSISKLNPRLT